MKNKEKIQQARDVIYQDAMIPPIGHEPKHKFKFAFWKSSYSGRIQFAQRFTPCECGCDSREDTESEKLKDYWMFSIFGFGMTILRYERIVNPT